MHFRQPKEKHTHPQFFFLDSFGTLHCGMLSRVLRVFCQVAFVQRATSSNRISCTSHSSTWDVEANKGGSDAMSVTASGWADPGSSLKHESVAGNRNGMEDGKGTSLRHGASCETKLLGSSGL